MVEKERQQAAVFLHLDDIVERATVALIEEALVHEHRNLCADGVQLQSAYCAGLQMRGFSFLLQMRGFSFCESEDSQRGGWLYLLSAQGTVA